MAAYQPTAKKPSIFMEHGGRCKFMVAVNSPWVIRLLGPQRPCDEVGHNAVSDQLGWVYFCDEHDKERIL